MCKLESKDGTTSQPVYVIDSLSRPLLGLPAIEALQLVEWIDAVESTEDRLKKKFPKVFTGLGKLDGDYCIRLKYDAVQYALTTPRRVSIPLENKIKGELERMEQMGVISRIEQLTEWCAAMVPVVGNSKHLITPFGRFCFNVLPFGINSGPEHFQRRMSQFLYGITGVICHADNVLNLW